MNESRALEEGLARTESRSDFVLSPSNTFCNPEPPSVSEKGSEILFNGHGAHGDYLHDQQQSRGRWFGLFGNRRASEVPSHPDDEPRPGLVVRPLERFPEGYPNLAAFQDSDESFMIYRRFGYLQSRVLLAKQDEMRVLEEELDALDAEDMFDNPDSLTMRLSDEGRGDDRRLLLSKIENKYLSYAKFLSAAHQLAALHRPGSDELESVRNYLHNEKPVDAPERSYINYAEDLVTLRPGREHAWLDTIIEKVLKHFRCRPLDYLFCDELTRRKTNKPEGAYYSRNRIERCAVGIITIMILALLVVPIYLLYNIVSHNLDNGVLSGKSNAVCIGILLVFTLAFSAMMCLFTRAKRHEILGAAAAYCAVLVVFFGNVGSN